MFASLRNFLDTLVILVMLSPFLAGAFFLLAKAIHEVYRIREWLKIMRREENHGAGESVAANPVYQRIEAKALSGGCFGWALEQLKAGKRLARAGWNGKGMWIARQNPDAHNKNTLPYLYIEYPAGHPAYPAGSRVPWLPSQTDMLAEDWFVVEQPSVCDAGKAKKVQVGAVAQAQAEEDVMAPAGDPNEPVPY